MRDHWDKVVVRRRTWISVVPVVLLLLVTGGCEKLSWPVPGHGPEEMARLQAELDSLKAIVVAVDRRVADAGEGGAGLRAVSLSAEGGSESPEMAFALSTLASRVDSMGKALARASRLNAHKAAASAPGLSAEQVDRMIRRALAELPAPEPTPSVAGGASAGGARLSAQNAYRVGPQSPVAMSKAKQNAAGILVGSIHAGRNGRGILSGSAGGATAKASVHWKDFGANQNVFCTDNSFVLPVPANTGWQVSAYQWDGQVEAMVYWYPIE